MSTKDSRVGSVRSRAPGSPPSTRPSKVQKVYGFRWSHKRPSESERLRAAEAVPVDPVVIREFEGANKAQGTAVFTCTSGELLWGHLNTVIEGWKSKEVDTTSGPSQCPIGGGTIVQHEFHYRAKARKGTWKVEPAFIGDWHFGYVCYHEDKNGMDLLRLAEGITFYNRTERLDKSVVYVNRYDWGSHHNPGLSIVLEALEVGLTTSEAWENWHEDEEMESYLENLTAFRFMMLDPKGMPTLIQALKDGEPLESKNYTLQYPPVAAPEAATNGNAEEGKTQNLGAADSVKGNGAGSAEAAGNGAEAVKSAVAGDDSSTPFGVNLVVKKPDYELGWMLFEEGELVGFVYDGEYSALEAEGKEMKLGGPVSTEREPKVETKSPERVYDWSGGEDSPYSPSTDTESTDSEPDERYYAGSETESEAGSQATSGQTGGSRETRGGDEEQGEECVSKDAAASAPALETIHEEDDIAEASEQQKQPSGDPPKPVAAASLGRSTLSADARPFYPSGARPSSLA